MAAPPGARPARTAPPTARRRAAGLVLLAVGLVLLAVLAWAALSLYQVRGAAQEAADHVAEVRVALDERDAAAALAAARAAASETSRAQDAASSLSLRLLSHLPVSGPLLTDARSLISATDLAVGAGALPLLEAAATLDSRDELVRDDGGIDVARLTAAAASVSGAAAALRTAQDQVEALEPGSFPSQVRGAVTDIREGVGELAARADDADTALAVLPAALGADGPRSYLVVFQNPAEARPTGGLVGTWALVAVDQGAVSLTGVGANDDLSGARTPASTLSPELQAVYGTETVRLQNANLSPDFTVAAGILADIWTGLGHAAPDGIVAVDPQGMAPLLRGQGEIAVPGGPAVSAETVVDVLLRQAYERFADDNAGRNAYLSAVVGTVFAQAIGGGTLTPEVLGGVVDAAEDGHLLAWSPRRDEQAALVRAGLSGALTAPAPGDAAVYFTNVDASKLDYYLRAAVRTTPGCAPAAAGEEVMSVELGNEAPEEVPEYVSSKKRSRPDTTHTTQVALYLPPGRGVAGVTVDGAPAAFATGTESGWSWVRLDVDVPRGARVVVDVRLVGDVPVDRVRTQPLVEPLEVSLANCPPS